MPESLSVRENTKLVVSRAAGRRLEVWVVLGRIMVLVKMVLVMYILAGGGGAVRLAETDHVAGEGELLGGYIFRSLKRTGRFRGKVPIMDPIFPQVSPVF
jgi:hypothetical protein